MKSCVTLSLVSSLKGGPWILWDDLEKGIKEASELGFECIELFTAGPSAGKANELNKLLSDYNISLGAVGTGAGKVLNGFTLTHPNKKIRHQAISFITEMINFGAEHNAPQLLDQCREVMIRISAEKILYLGSLRLWRLWVNMLKTTELNLYMSH